VAWNDSAVFQQLPATGWLDDIARKGQLTSQSDDDIKKAVI
jgi:hypothetical protein